LAFEKVLCYIDRTIYDRKGASMTITKKRTKRKSVLILPLLLCAMLAPSVLWAGGKKEEEKQPVNQESQAEKKERTPIELGEPSNRAATVNGTVIEMDRYERQLEAIQQQYLMQGQSIPEGRLGELKLQVLESLIDQEILYQEAKKAGYEADKEQLDQQLQQIKGQFPSEEQYRQTMAQQGVSEESILEELDKALVVQNYITERFTSKVTLTEADARAYYETNPQYFVQPEQVRASHILFTVKPDASAEEVAAARKKAEATLERYESGEEFSDLARELSEGPSAPQGGDLGSFGRNQMVKPFEDAAFSMEVGDVSDPVRTDFGFHLIRLTAKNDEEVVPFQQVSDQISDHLYKLQLGELVNAFLEEKKSEYDITRFIDTAAQ
jgi:peptidyl-prolyl cis-trans isomerase C